MEETERTEEACKGKKENRWRKEKEETERTEEASKGKKESRRRKETEETERTEEAWRWRGDGFQIISKYVNVIKKSNVLVKWKLEYWRYSSLLSRYAFQFKPSSIFYHQLYSNIYFANLFIMRSFTGFIQW